MKVEEWEQLKYKIIYEVTKLGIIDWQIESVESSRRGGIETIKLLVVDNNTYGPVSRATLQVDKDVLFVNKKEANLYYLTKKKKELEKELREIEKELEKWGNKHNDRKKV